MRSEPGRRWLLLTGLLCALLCLRQGLALLDAALPLRQQQQHLMQQHNIEPAALFYTEVDAALTGSRRIRQQLCAHTTPASPTATVPGPAQRSAIPARWFSASFCDSAPMK